REEGVRQLIAAIAPPAVDKEPIAKAVSSSPGQGFESDQKQAAAPGQANLVRQNGADAFKRVTNAAHFLLKLTDLRPEIGVLLGSGFKGYLERLEHSISISYSKIPNFPSDSNDGTLSIGIAGGRPIALMEGRLHLHDRLQAEEVVFPVRMLA